jgi:hypothetical protein
MLTRVTERVDRPLAGCRVDRENGIIRGAKLCGLTSANGRSYPAEVFRRGVAKYEGVHVYANHTRGERSIGDKLGWITNARIGPDGVPRGDLNLLTTHPDYPAIVEAAQRNPSLYGLSHVADCRVGRGTNGREQVESIESVVSVDLVAEPATTRGIFESRSSQRGKSMRLKEYAVRVGKRVNERRRRLLHEVAMTEPDAEVTDADVMTGDDRDETAAALCAAGRGVWERIVWGQVTPEEGLARLRKFARIAAQLMATNDDDDEPAEESRRPRSSADFLATITESRDLSPESVTAFMRSLRR